jgi:mannosyltransferase OCH1-like enzyme
MSSVPITKKIHQIWVGPHPIPEKSAKFIKKIQELHPEYEYRLWVDSDLIEENFSNIHYIRATPIYAQKADIMRYEILYRHGGVYLDIDFEIIRPLTPYLTTPLVVCNEDANVDQYMTNAFIYAHPGLPSLQRCVEMIGTCQLGGQVNVAVATGPWYFRKHFVLDADTAIIPTHMMYPVHFTQKHTIQNVKLPEDVIGIHHWDKSW